MIYGIAAYKINDSDEEFDVGNGIIEKEISAAGSEGAAEKSQCLYNQKGRRQSDPTG